MSIVTPQAPPTGAGLIVHVAPSRPGKRPQQSAQPSGVIRLAMRLLDLLPWPLGEWMCGVLFLLRNVVRPGVAMRAVRWLAHYPSGVPVWWRACRLFLYQGRFRGRHALLGLRTPADLAGRVRIDGREHLPQGGAILLGFHVGAPAVGDALVVSGVQVHAVVGGRYSRAWESEAWAPVRASFEQFPLTEDASVLGGVLYRMRHALAAGGRMYVAADGLKGRVAFTLQVRDTRVLRVKSGWLMLVAHTGVPVVPVTSHYEGNVQVVTLHPRLPAFDPKSADGLARCQAYLQAVLEGYAAAHPEQGSGFVYSY